jgi:hypothetical protein
MQHRPVLGFVDLIPGEHLLDGVPQFHFFSQGQQQFHGLGGNPVLGKIYQKIIECYGEFVKPLRILSKPGFHVFVPDLLVMLAKALPTPGAGGIDLV